VPVTGILTLDRKQKIIRFIGKWAPQTPEKELKKLTLPKIKRMHFLIFLLAFCIVATPFRARLRSFFVSILQILRGKKTISQRVNQYKHEVDSRLVPVFQKAGIDYPPEKVILVGLKHEKMLEVWASNGSNDYKRIKSYPILAASGTIGPKLREGDAQVPEGIYHVESLNPNSLYHLALRLDYPNEFDREMARLDGREHIGSDIMIHGKECSIGCLAMGDAAAEDLFVLAALVGIENISVIVSPVDFRSRDLPAGIRRATPEWTLVLYDQIKGAMTQMQGESRVKMLDE
jgi:hypothetical protein